jgi:hypothetical protein
MDAAELSTFDLGSRDVGGPARKLRRSFVAQRLNSGACREPNGPVVRVSPPSVVRDAGERAEPVGRVCWRSVFVGCVGGRKERAWSGRTGRSVSALLYIMSIIGVQPTGVLAAV